LQERNHATTKVILRYTLVNQCNLANVKRSIYTHALYCWQLLWIYCEY